MNTDELLKRFENEWNGLSEKDKLGMILSNFIDYGGHEGAMISDKQFDELSDTIIKFYKGKMEVLDD